jgi:hypothetical protein
MEQVNELLDVIQALKLIGVIGSLVMCSFFERWVRTLQKRCQFCFAYLGPEDPSQMYAKELPPGEALKQVKCILMDVHSVPYGPALFSASNQPKPVCYLFVRVLLTFAYDVSSVYY